MLLTTVRDSGSLTSRKLTNKPVNKTGRSQFPNCQDFRMSKGVLAKIQPNMTISFPTGPNEHRMSFALKNLSKEEIYIYTIVIQRSLICHEFHLGSSTNVGQLSQLRAMSGCSRALAFCKASAWQMACQSLNHLARWKTQNIGPRI